MSRRDDRRLEDILAAAAAIADHTRRGGLEDGLVFDAVRIRLIEIGEAVKAIDSDLLKLEPGIPWADVAGMRNHLAHRYFDTAHSILQSTIEQDLPPLVAAADRLLAHVNAQGTF
ncbi:HepT-like ribonuclease domain-containing protein [Saccharopolyspora shandongensis]|uniref:HepT-like ribonuclease domain-containing protein n=1 Tax=Saccharopolyspora shandongensis TaxID=418495 RepID=UPI003427F916